MIVEYYDDNPDIEGILFCIDALRKEEAQPRYTELYARDGIFYGTDSERMHVFEPKKRDTKDGFYRVLNDDEHHVVLYYKGKGNYPDAANLTKGKKIIREIGVVDFSSGVSELAAAIIRALPVNQFIDIDFLRDIPHELFHCDILENDVIRLSSKNKTAFIMPMRDDP